MNALFVADLHLTPARPEAIRRFTAFLDDVARGADAVYILGDLFEYWIGDDAAEPLGYAEVLDALARLTASGVAAYFLPGNRDFLVGAHFVAQTGCRLLADPTRITLKALPVLLTHGDALCTDDVRHQRARALTARPALRRFFLALPLRARLRIAEAIRRRSARNKAGMSPVVMDVNAEAVVSLMRARNVTTLIHGHTHRPALHELKVDGRECRRFVLGDWYETGSALRYRDGRFETLAI
jgi:UDP-2,3-diacylglucosamine hydrolase